MKSIRLVASFIPYAAIALGLFWFKNAWIALLGYHTALLVILLIEKPTIPVSTFLKSNNPVLLTGGVILGGCSGLCLYFVWPILNVSKSLPVDLAALGLSSAIWLVFIAYFALVNPWIEEYFWRGYLGSPAKGLALTDLYFAGYHLLVIYDKISWTWSLLTIVSLVFIGWFWRQMRCRSDGLLMSSLSHMAADFSIMTAVYLKCTKG